MNLTPTTASSYTYSKAGDLFKMRFPKGDKKGSPRPMPAEQLPNSTARAGWTKPHAGPLPVETAPKGFPSTTARPTVPMPPTGTNKFGDPLPKPAEQIQPGDSLLQKFLPVNTNVIQLLDMQADSEALKA